MHFHAGLQQPLTDPYQWPICSGTGGRFAPESPALHGLIEEFVTRGGTDTGYTDGSLEESVESVMQQLNNGDAVIVYDEATQTANIVPKELPDYTAFS